MPGNPNLPLSDETGLLIVAALNNLTAAIQANSKELADLGETQDTALFDRQKLATCLQTGVPYVPATTTPIYSGTP